MAAANTTSTNFSGYNGSGGRTGGRIEGDRSGGRFKQAPKDRGSGRRKC